MPAISNRTSPSAVTPSTGRPHQTPTGGPQPSPAQERKGDATSRTFASTSIPKNSSTPLAARPAGASCLNDAPPQTQAGLPPFEKNTFSSRRSSGSGAPGTQPATSLAHTFSPAPLRSGQSQTTAASVKIGNGHSSFVRPAPTAITTDKQSAPLTFSSSRKKAQTSFTPSPLLPSTTSSQFKIQSFLNHGHVHSASFPASSTLKSSTTQRHNSDTRTAVQTSLATTTISSSSATNSLSSGSVTTPFGRTTSVQSSSEGHRRQSTTTLSTTSFLSSSILTTLRHKSTTTPGLNLTIPNPTHVHFSTSTSQYDTSTSFAFGSIPHTHSRSSVGFPGPGHSVPKHGSATPTLFGTSPIATFPSSKHNSSSSTTAHRNQTRLKSQNPGSTYMTTVNVTSPFTSHGQVPPATSRFGATSEPESTSSSEKHSINSLPTITYSTMSRGQAPSQTTTRTLKISTTRLPNYGQGPPAMSTDFGTPSPSRVTLSFSGHSDSFPPPTATHVQATQKGQNPTQAPSRKTLKPPFTTHPNYGQGPSTTSLHFGTTSSSNTSSLSNGNNNNPTPTEAHSPTPSKGNLSHSTVTPVSQSQVTEMQTFPTSIVNHPGTSQMHPSPGHPEVSSSVSEGRPLNPPPRTAPQPAQSTKQTPSNSQRPPSSRPAPTTQVSTSKPSSKVQQPTRSQNPNPQRPASEAMTSGNATQIHFTRTVSIQSPTHSTQRAPQRPTTFPTTDHLTQTTAQEQPSQSTTTPLISNERSSDQSLSSSGTSSSDSTFISASLTGTVNSSSTLIVTSATNGGRLFLPGTGTQSSSNASMSVQTSAPVTSTSSSVVTRNKSVPSVSSGPVTPTVLDPKRSSRKTNTGVKAGSAIASVITAIVIAVVVFILCRRKRHRQRVVRKSPRNNSQVLEASGVLYSPALSANGGRLYDQPVHTLLKGDEDTIRPSFSTVQNVSAVEPDESPCSPPSILEPANYLDGVSDDEGTMYGYQQSKHSSYGTSDYVSVQEHLPDDRTEVVANRIMSIDSHSTFESNVEYGLAL